jgi:hypothetical protein
MNVVMAVAAVFLFAAGTFSAGVTTSAPAAACICDEICRPGEVYSDEHETCIGGEEVSEEEQEKPTS